MYSPKWSKAKKNLKSMTCESLAGRVDFQVINYRKAHDGLGRAVITVDGRELLSMCTITAEREEYEKEWALRHSQGFYEFDDVGENIRIQDIAHQLLKQEGIYGQYDFFDALESYFNAPISESLASKNHIIQILSLIDRRVGKRTLVKMEKRIANEPEWVQRIYKLRCEAEGIRLENGDPEYAN